MQLEKEILERMQREERVRIEAQIKTAEAATRMRAEEELKKQREKEREVARVAIEKMKRTVEIEHNLEAVKELEILSGSEYMHSISNCRKYCFLCASWVGRLMCMWRSMYECHQVQKHIVQQLEYLNTIPSNNPTSIFFFCKGLQLQK